jgi:hypothetical protein
MNLTKIKLSITGAPKPSKETLEAMRLDVLSSLQPPRVVQVNYSGGSASETMLHMILNGDLIPPAPIIVTCADPGMENPMTYVHTAAMEQQCKARGIPFLRAHVNLYEGIMTAKARGLTRFDFPAFFTKDRDTGKIGKMMQRCTKWCKAAPMDRLCRSWMHANLQIPIRSSRLGFKIVHKWIGFTYDEWTRIKPFDTPKYILLDYPFVNHKITKQNCLDYLTWRGLPIPPRSVCSGCFANDAAYFKMLHDTCAFAWNQAVSIDEMIRDLSQFGMRDECYVYGACIPLTRLAELGFPDLRDREIAKQFNLTAIPNIGGCHSGHCFI